MLNALDLATNYGQQYTAPRSGQKAFEPGDSWIEAMEIQTAIKERKSLLQAERIDKWCNRSIASWLPDINVAEVTRKVGNYWQTVGTEKNGKLLLHPEEALYMLETNILELQYGGVAVSVQQAYALLLGSRCSLNEYRTYAKLQRLGMVILFHLPVSREENCPQSKLLHSGTKRKSDKEQNNSTKKRQSCTVNPVTNRNIEIVNLEDDEQEILEFLPNARNKESVCVIVAPRHLLPPNIKPVKSEYKIQLRNLNQPGIGARPAQPPSIELEGKTETTLLKQQDSKQSKSFTQSTKANFFQPCQQLWRTGPPLTLLRFPQFQPYGLMHQLQSMRSQNLFSPMLRFPALMRFPLASPLHRPVMIVPIQAQNTLANLPQRCMLPNNVPKRYISGFVPMCSRWSQQSYGTNVPIPKSELQKIKINVPSQSKNKAKDNVKSWAECKFNATKSIGTITLDMDDMMSPAPLLQPEDCKTLDTIYNKLQIFKSPKEDYSSSKTKKTLRIKYDVFPHNGAFRKSLPPTPTYQVVVLSNNDEVPSDSEIADIEGKVPILFAIVQNDSVNFISLAPIDLPTLTV